MLTPAFHKLLPYQPLSLLSLSQGAQPPWPMHGPCDPCAECSLPVWLHWCGLRHHLGRRGVRPRGMALDPARSQAVAVVRHGVLPRDKRKQM